MITSSRIVPYSTCFKVQEVCVEVANWIAKQPAVGEESITDWLLYSLSQNLFAFKYYKFTKHEEARTTGADWEWWIVGDQYSLRLRIQAKKLKLTHDNYPSIAYSNNYGMQIDKLLGDAAAVNALPLYAFYAPTGFVQCIDRKRDDTLLSAVSLASAEAINRQFITPAKQRVGLKDVAPLSYPLHCLALSRCFDSRIDPIDAIRNHLLKSLGVGSENDETGIHKTLPPYVKSLLQNDEQELLSWFEGEFRMSLPDISNLVVLDLRRSQNQK